MTSVGPCVKSIVNVAKIRRDAIFVDLGSPTTSCLPDSTATDRYREVSIVSNASTGNWATSSDELRASFLITYNTTGACEPARAGST